MTSIAATVSMIVAMATVSVWAAAPASAASAPINSAGPLTRVEISDTLNCAVDHAGDSAPEWFDDTACGTLIAVGGTVYGPADIPAGGSAGQTSWTPVSQSPVTGAGTNADPYRIVTVVDGGGLRVTESDAYVVGEESYSTTISVQNTSGAAATAELYRAGDCFLQGSDQGYGSVDAASGAVACTTDTAPGSRIEQLLPITAGSQYLEGFYATVWGAVGSQQPLPSTCDCMTQEDNGIGLSWPVSLTAGQSKNYSSIVTFSPLGHQPLTITKTADTASVPAGASDGYTVVVKNTNANPVTLTTLSDTLGAGFTYVAGSSTGATTSNPVGTSGTITWSGITVPGNGTATLHFGVTVSTTPGTYTDEADGDATGYTVVGTGAAAPVTVTAVNHAPVASPQSVSTPQNTAKAVTLSASDAEGDALTYSVVAGPVHGTLSGSAPALTYTPTAGYTGSDSFTFKANDGTVDSNTATVSITVTAVNHAPVASPQSVSTPQNTAKAVTLSASDADGDALTYSVVAGPVHGTLSGSAPALTYTPTAGYTGSDSFTFKANDGTVDSNTATVSITVTAVNHAPVASPQSVSTPQNTAKAVTLSASDAEGDALTYSVVAGPVHGTLSGSAPALTYTPTAGYTGSDSFTFKANDGTVDSNTATVSITVTPVSTSCPTTAPTVDVSVSADQKNPAAKFKSPSVTTTGPGELILAFIESDGPAAPTQRVAGVTGAGLTWTLAARSNATWGTTEVWQAYAVTTISNATVVATLAKSGWDGSITVAAFKGAGSHVGATATGAGTSGSPSATVTPTSCNSLIWAAGHDWTRAIMPAPVAGQSLVHGYVDRRVHDAYWTQKVDVPTVGTAPVTVKDTGPTNDRWTIAAVEIRGV